VARIAIRSTIHRHKLVAEPDALVRHGAAKTTSATVLCARFVRNPRPGAPAVAVGPLRPVVCLAASSVASPPAPTYQFVAQPRRPRALPCGVSKARARSSASCDRFIDRPSSARAQNGKQGLRTGADASNWSTWAWRTIASSAVDPSAPYRRERRAGRGDLATAPAAPRRRMLLTLLERSIRLLGRLPLPNRHARRRGRWGAGWAMATELVAAAFAVSDARCGRESPPCTRA
jgi:hypothetical protein